MTLKKNTRYKTLCFVGLLLIFSCQNLPKIIIPSKEKNINAKLGEFFRKEFQSERVSFSLFNLSHNEDIYSLNADEVMIPASNIKLVTMVGVYGILEPSYSPFLEVFKKGKIINEELNGDLIIKGNGAIFFGQHSFENSIEQQKSLLEYRIKKMIRSLNTLGIKAIRGKLVCDSSNWLHGLKNSFYNAAGAQLFYENTLQVGIKNKRLSVVPSDTLPFILKRDDKVKKQQRNKNIIHINYNHNSNDYWRLENYSSDDYFIKQFTTHLRKNGFDIHNEEVPNIKDFSKETVVTFQGLSLDKMADDILTHSDNLKAELAFLYIGRNDSIDYNYSSKVITNKINSLLNSKSVLIKDGSGLSRYNRLSARQAINIIKLIRKEVHLQPLISKLAVAGKTGTLAKHFINSPWSGNFRGKTGSLDDVVCLTGLFNSRHTQKDIAFSILINKTNYTSSWKKIEKLAKLIDSLSI